jgi:hypothetical protein
MGWAGIKNAETRRGGGRNEKAPPIGGALQSVEAGEN